MAGVPNAVPDPCCSPVHAPVAALVHHMLPWVFAASPCMHPLQPWCTDCCPQPCCSPVHAQCATHPAPRANNTAHGPVHTPTASPAAPSAASGASSTAPAAANAVPLHGLSIQLHPGHDVPSAMAQPSSTPAATLLARTHACIPTCICMHTFVHIHARPCACIHTCRPVHVRSHPCTGMHTHTHAHLQVCTHFHTWCSSAAGQSLEVSLQPAASAWGSPGGVLGGVGVGGTPPRLPAVPPSLWDSRGALGAEGSSGS